MQEIRISSALSDQSTELWDIMPGESAAAFEAFCKYRDMPPSKRSISSLLNQFVLQATEGFFPPTTTRGTMDAWKREYRWDERAAAWDAELDRIWRDEQCAAVRDAARRQLHESQMLQSVGMAALERVSPDDLSMEIQEVRRFITEGAAMERALLGLDKKKEGPKTQVINPIMVIQMADMMEERLRSRGQIVDAEVKRIE